MKRALSFFLAALMALSVTGCGSGMSAAPDVYADKLMTLEVASDVPDSLDVNLLNYAVSLATYPESVPYPREEDFLTEEGTVNREAYDAAYQDWMQAQLKQPALPDNTAALNPFFRSGVKEFLSGDGNRVCSPLNVYMALAMLAEASGGESRQQILKLLGTESLEALRAQANAVWNALYLDDGTTTRLLGSSFWLNDKVNFNEETLETIAKNYYASSFTGTMGAPEYTAALQSWLNEQTRGLLKDQAGGIELTADTLIALAASIYFKAPWTNQFDEGETLTQVFHAPDGDVNAPFMHDSFTAMYYKGNGFGAVALPLSEGQMWLILPDEGTTPAELLNSGAAMDFLAATEANTRSTRSRVVLSLPKFDVSADLTLNDSLKALGVTDIFEASKADFAPLTSSQRAVLNKIQHAARVKIDEEGCEAAAYTVAMVSMTAALEQPPTVEFNLDRPFLFAVTAQRNLPLFVGVVAKPAAA